MSAATGFFYLFSGLLVASGFMVIASRNPVHSVLFLIFAFVNAAGLFVLLGAEYLAMLLVVVYVGAVAVLFLFVVMMLDVDFAALRQGAVRYLPLGGVVGAVFLLELALVAATFTIAPDAVASRPSPLPVEAMNIRALGRVLYTQHVGYFQTAGLILLVAMIGAIVLTLRERAGSKRQDVATQVNRTKATAIEVRTVRSREGV